MYVPIQSQPVQRTISGQPYRGDKVVTDEIDERGGERGHSFGAYGYGGVQPSGVDWGSLLGSVLSGLF
jgi:hypothetical protein